jgi:hypothetical protein
MCRSIRCGPDGGGATLAAQPARWAHLPLFIIMWPSRIGIIMRSASIIWLII